MAKPIEYIDGRERTDTGAPHTVDLRITGQCQLRCDWCWGPEHFRKGGVTPEQWQETIGRLATSGTRQAGFSGGEPTLSNSLRPGIAAAKASGLRVTLSTNGILLAQNKDVLRTIDDVGIPIEGSTPEINDDMRRWTVRHNAWRKAIDAVRLAQQMKRDGEADLSITARTVIARPNLHDVPNIPSTLEENGIDLSDLRMKMYQVEPFGPHFRHTDFDAEWAVTAEEAQNAALLAQQRNPNANITLQLYGATAGRYFLVDPDGYATGTGEDERGVPIEVPYGNLVHDFDATLEAYGQHMATLNSME